VRHQHGPAQGHFILIVQQAVDFRGRVMRVGIREIGRAAAFHHGYIAIHHHVLRTGLPNDVCTAGIVVPVCVADE